MRDRLGRAFGSRRSKPFGRRGIGGLARAAAAAILLSSGAAMIGAAEAQTTGGDADAGPKPGDWMDQQGAPLPLDVLLDGAFDATAFSNEQAGANFERVVFDPSARRLAALPELAEGPARVLKWEDPVRYRVLGDGALRRDTVATVLLAAELEEAIGRARPLEIRPAVGGARPNLSVFVISFAVRTDLANQIETARAEGGEAAGVDRVLAAWLADETSPCMTSVREDPLRPGVIAEAMVVLRSEESLETRDQCVQREVLRAFGLLNLHEDVTPSILNPLSTAPSPTEHDLFLTTVLYDPRITPGMAREAAAPLARDIIAELREDPPAPAALDGAPAVVE